MTQWSLEDRIGVDWSKERFHSECIRLKVKLLGGGCHSIGTPESANHMCTLGLCSIHTCLSQVTEQEAGGTRTP